MLMRRSADRSVSAIDERTVPARMVAASIVGLWLCYYLLTTTRGLIIGLPMESDLLGRRALVSLIGIAVTFGLWLFLRLFDGKALWFKIVAALIAALPASVIIAQGNQWVFADIEARLIQQIGQEQGVALRRDEAGNILVDIPSAAIGNRQSPASVTIARAPTGIDKWRKLTDIALGRYFLLLAWAALYLALLAGAQARAAERREANFRQAAKAAELRSLRYQVNPHFLFNAFNSLSALVMTGKTDRAEEMIQTLSHFYRHNLADDPTADVSLADEFGLQTLYLEIEKVRFPARLKTRIDLPPTLREFRVPGMILQPLVENSVKYGVARNSRPVTIQILARKEDGELVLIVKDDGGPAERPVSNGLGIGLTNVRDRLLARFGDAATLMHGATNEGYATQIKIPLR